MPATVRRFAGLSTLVSAMLAAAIGAGEAPAGWPCWRGPYQNGKAAPSAEKLIEDPTQARLLWRSEAVVPKGYNGFINAGCVSPVIAEGKVFQYYVPGSLRDVVLPADYNAAKSEAYYRSGEGVRFNKGIPHHYQQIPLADFQKLHGNLLRADRVVCIDLDTGRTLWDRELELSSALPARLSAHAVPHYREGRLYVPGYGGILYCLDARDGQVVWQVERPERARTLESLARVREARSTKRGGGGTNHLICAGEVVFWLDTAYDPATGAVRWQTNRHGGSAFPQTWSHRGREYLLLGGRAVDPATGEELWRIKGVANGGRNHGSAGITEDRIVFPTLRTGSGKGDSVGPVCYRVDPAGAEEAWRAPAQLKGGSCSLTVADGRVYFYGKSGKTKSNNCYELFCLDLASGEVLARHRIGTNNGIMTDDTGKTLRPAPFGNGADSHSSTWVFNGWLCYRSAAKDRDNAKVVFWRADPADFRFLGVVEPESYTCAHTAAVADGRLVLRGYSTLFCYDFRAR